MRNMSFALTTEQARNKTKVVTRRQGWWNAKPGQLVQQVVKGMGLKKGEKVEKIHVIQIISVGIENIYDITQEDVILEGFPDWEPNDFIAFYCKAHKLDPQDICNRIFFKYVKDPAP